MSPQLEKIKILRSKNMSYESIGAVLGITRQRVHQIYKGYLSIPPNQRRLIINIFNPKVCEICGNRIKKSEITIHHLDNNPKNNKQSNIVFCHYFCHRLFEGHKPTREVASNKAYLQEYTCINCGKTFRKYKWQPHSGYCSIKCAKDYVKDHAYFVFDCKGCGKEFFRSGRHYHMIHWWGREPQYCCVRCEKPILEPVTKRCIRCGKEFICATSRRIKYGKYCSQTCNLADLHSTNREYKLTTAEKDRIISLRRQGMRVVDIAKQFPQVSYATVSIHAKKAK